MHTLAYMDILALVNGMLMVSCVLPVRSWCRASLLISRQSSLTHINLTNYNLLLNCTSKVDMNYGLNGNGNVRQVFESLMAFYPGLQVLLGELVPSAKTLNSFFLVREFLGLLPGEYQFNSAQDIVYATTCDLLTEPVALYHLRIYRAL